MTAFMPVSDSNSRLQASRGKYQYNYTHVSPLALLDRVPIHDEFSFGWLKVVAERVMVGLENMAAIEMDATYRSHHLEKHGLFRRMLEVGTAAIGGLKNLVEDALKLNPRLGSQFIRPESLDEYSHLFHSIALPPIAKDAGDDRVFAWMRLGGPNAVMIRRFTATDERFPVTDIHLGHVVVDDSLDAAMAEGRLYLADYKALDGAELGEYPHGQKYVYAPLALFVVAKTTKELLPVAIQCKQQPASDNPIFTPGDGYNWLIAKTIVEIADGNVHEAVTHLGKTHMLMEPFVVSTYRQLTPDHPLALLLAPHFEGTLAINEAAWRHLIANKGAVDKLFGCSINAARQLTVDGVRGTDFLRSVLPATFAARGVDDAQLLPGYPYRDDSLLYWNAIETWVTGYLQPYYPSAADVAGDIELQCWVREIGAIDGGRISGVGRDGAVATFDDLVDIVTLVIYTCSVQHAAVNFPQYDLMSYVPNMPLAAYTPAPTTRTGATEADYLAMLPPMDMAELQLNLGYLLGTVHYTQLGQYDPKHFSDPQVAVPLRRFQEQLASIGQTVDDRNARRRPYTFLEPAGVPQSINI